MGLNKEQGSGLRGDGWKGCEPWGPAHPSRRSEVGWALSSGAEAWVFAAPSDLSERPRLVFPSQTAEGAPRPHDRSVRCAGWGGRTWVIQAKQQGTEGSRASHLACSLLLVWQRPQPSPELAWGQTGVHEDPVMQPEPPLATGGGSLQASRASAGRVPCRTGAGAGGAGGLTTPRQQHAGPHLDPLE